jgi:energy-coupling factor transporter ATP-binding protein EcfA2
MDLTIRPAKSVSSQLPSNELMDQGIIPKFGKGSSIALIGRTGSGKSVLLSNLLTREEFYGTFFKPENRYLFSPTADVDSVADEMNIPKKNKVSSGMKGRLEAIWTKRAQEVKQAGGAHNVEPMCLVFDDLTGNVKLQNSKVFQQVFTAGRHLGILSFVCVHKISALKRVCRLSCNYIYIFQSTNTEVEILVKEQRPSCLTKEQFADLISYCWEGDYDFLSINNIKPEKERYMHNLTELLQL